MTKDDWTPYGLEAIRQAHLLKRRIIGAVLALAMLGAWSAFVMDNVESELRISVNGQDAGSSITIDAPEEEERNNKVTISLSPGRVQRVETGSDSAPAQPQRASTPSQLRAQPIPWVLVGAQLAPWLLLGTAAWFLGSRRGKHDEVNYGVYKGSMPLEMLTSAHSRHVFTKRRTSKSVFGKGRSDHLPDNVRAAHKDAEDEA